MSGGVPDIICVAQITLKFVDHALILDNRGFLLFKGKNLANLSGLKNGFNLDTTIESFEEYVDPMEEVIHTSFLPSLFGRVEPLPEELYGTCQSITCAGRDWDSRS